MYKVEYLPVALQDMVEIARYISIQLKNPSAAEHLSVELIEAGEGLSLFPYANPTLIPVRPLKYEYRKLLVKNYMMLYRVDECNKTVIIARVVYAKRNYGVLVE